MPAVTITTSTVGTGRLLRAQLTHHTAEQTAAPAVTITTSTVGTGRLLRAQLTHHTAEQTAVPAVTITTSTVGTGRLLRAQLTHHTAEITAVPAKTCYRGDVTGLSRRRYTCYKLQHGPVLIAYREMDRKIRYRSWYTQSNNDSNCSYEHKFMEKRKTTLHYMLSE